MAFLGFVAAWAAAVIGYKQARTFVRQRLRYVDGVHKAFVPLKVGVITAAVTMPIMWVLPIITGGAAVLLGTAVGLGVSAGRKDIKERRYLRA